MTASKKLTPKQRVELMGKRVVASCCLIRTHEQRREQKGTGMATAKWRIADKYQSKYAFPVSGWVVGFRVFSDGTWSVDEGECSYRSTRSISVVLVAVHHNQKPIVVPIDQIKLVEEEKPV